MDPTTFFSTFFFLFIEIYLKVLVYIKLKEKKMKCWVTNFQAQMMNIIKKQHAYEVITNECSETINTFKKT